MPDICDRHDIHVAQLWAAFGQGANMPFVKECVDFAFDRGYYGHVSNNCEIFKTNPKEFEAARRCCIRAGRIAAGHATHAELDVIDIDSFIAACERLEELSSKLREKAKRKGEARPDAGVCG